MHLDAARRARQKTIKADLTQAFTDEEACTPDWVDLLQEVGDGLAQIRSQVRDEHDHFLSEPDIRVALARRERVAQRVHARAGELNKLVRRLNLIVPLSRFQRPLIDAAELLRPLYRARRRVS